MPSSRASLKELARLLDAAAEPIYVVDATGCIVYLNAACAAWLGCTREELVGQSGQYTSDPTVGTVADVANSLCPPPQVFQGKSQCGALLHPSGNTRRRATFLPLGISHDELQGIIAVVALDDEPADTPALSVDLAPTGHLESTHLHEALRKFRQRHKERFGLERLAGKSAAMVRVRSQVPLAASTNAAVQIVGPPGGICEHVARAIHLHGLAAADARFVPLDCAVLPAELLVSAMAPMFARKSKFPASDAPAAAQSISAQGFSTLVLTDAQAIGSDVQSELKRMSAACPADLRIVSTAPQSLVDIAHGGEFDPQLAAQLGTLCIEIPPLAQRPEDIPILAQLFVEDANADSAKQLAGFTSEAMDALAGYPWPRDVNELEEMVRAAHARAKGAEITVRDLPERIALAIDAAVYRRLEEPKINLEKYLKEIELELLQRAMKRAKGNKTKAARLLGMTRPRLYRRLVQLGLEKKPGRPARKKKPPSSPDEQVDFQEG